MQGTRARLLIHVTDLLSTRERTFNIGFRVLVEKISPSRLARIRRELFNAQEKYQMEPCSCFRKGNVPARRFAFTIIGHKFLKRFVPLARESARKHCAQQMRPQIHLKCALAHFPFQRKDSGKVLETMESAQFEMVLSSVSFSCITDRNENFELSWIQIFYDA